MRARYAALATGLALLPAACRRSLSPLESPPPGRLVDVGGRKLHLYCDGAGTPAVILLAGGGAYSIDWALVQPHLPANTRVCSYDRAGLGWSDPGPSDETVEQTVSDLHTLLHNAGEKGPYVLVGTSVAGIFIQAYQRAYAGEVAALVFSNSSNRIGRLVNGKAKLIWDMTEAEIRSTFPLPASAKGPAPAREDDPFDRLPLGLRRTRLWLDQKFWQTSDPAHASPDSTLSWRKEFLAEFDATGASEKPPLAALPVFVLSSGPAASESEKHSRAGAAARLDFLSSHTLHVTAAGSGHEIHLYQPDLVVQTILRAVSTARSPHS